MELLPLMTLTARIGESIRIGDNFLGKRSFAGITGGWFQGERLAGQVLPGGGDWLLMDSSGYARVDVRLTLATDDGANIYVRYDGVLEYNRRIEQARRLQGETQFGDARLLVHLRFETGVERYRWLNHCMAVGQGRLLPDAVQYRVCELA